MMLKDKTQEELNERGFYFNGKDYFRLGEKTSPESVQQEWDWYSNYEEYLRGRRRILMAETCINSGNELDDTTVRMICPQCQRGEPCMANDELLRQRSKVMSEPGAAIKVERYNLTDEEREGLTINVDLGNIEV